MMPFETRTFGPVMLELDGWEGFPVRVCDSASRYECPVGTVGEMVDALRAAADWLENRSTGSSSADRRGED